MPASLTRLQAELSRRLENIKNVGTADEKLVVERLPRVKEFASALAWIHQPEGGLDLVESLRIEVQGLWRQRRLDDRAIELVALLFLVGAEARILEELSGDGIGQERLRLSVDDHASAAILGLCLLDRGVQFEIDFTRGVIKARNVVSDFEVREPGNPGHEVIKRGVASVARAITGHPPGDGIESERALKMRLGKLDEFRGVGIAVAIPHGDPAGLLDASAVGFLQNVQIPAFFYGADHSSSNCNPMLLAEIERDLRAQLRDILGSMKPRDNATKPQPDASADTAPRPFVFFSYSHDAEDARWNKRVIDHLRVLDGLQKIELWVDVREIGAGDRWNDEIQEAIDRADIAVLMISTCFMNSEYIKRHERPPLQRKHKDGRLRLIPVLLGACSWKEDAELEPLQLATGETPLNTRTEVGDIDQECAKIAKEVLKR
jgi:hypothetical protein